MRIAIIASVLCALLVQTLFAPQVTVAQAAVPEGTVAGAVVPTQAPVDTIITDTLITATIITGDKRLRVRAAPGIEHPIRTHLANGQRVPVLARNGDGSWLLIIAPPATYGWISATYAALNVALSQVPVAGIPADAAPPPVAPLPMPAQSTQPTVRQPVEAPVLAPLTGKLAIPIFDENRRTYDVWLVNADGSGLRKVVDEASSPALSDDGSMLAYRRWQVEDRGIVVANSDGSNPLRVTDKLEDVLPSFSPDRTKVAFSSYRWGDRKNRLYYAWTDDKSRTAWEWGAGGIFGEDPDWVADGRIFYRASRRDQQVEELWSMNGTDGLGRQLLYSADSIRSPSVRQEGTLVTFMAQDAGNWDVYTLDLSTSAVRRLTTDSANDGLPIWSPDGRHIAFVSDRSGSWALWVMRADGSGQRLLASLPGSVDGKVEFEPDYLNNGWLEEQIAWSP